MMKTIMRKLFEPPVLFVLALVLIIVVVAAGYYADLHSKQHPEDYWGEVFTWCIPERYEKPPPTNHPSWPLIKMAVEKTQENLEESMYMFLLGNTCVFVIPPQNHGLAWAEEKGFEIRPSPTTHAQFYFVTYARAVLYGHIIDVFNVGFTQDEDDEWHIDFLSSFSEGYVYQDAEHLEKYGDVKRRQENTQ